MRYIATNSDAAISGEYGRRLVFYLSMEEYSASAMQDINEAFFLWQVPPTVIFGRNQVMEAEVNLPYCKENNVNLFRRKSGGGCVYSDDGNIMFSYVTDSTNVAETFDIYLDKLSKMLQSLGLDAYRSGRNDIMISGKKVSGNAFYKLPNRSIVHGTLLFNSDFEALQNAITPSSAKIGSKGVASVRQHVGNIKEFLEDLNPDEVSSKQYELATRCTDIKEFKKYVIEYFSEGDSPIIMTEKDIQGVEEIEKTYLDPNFLHGKKHQYDACFKKKLEGVGEFIVDLSLNGKEIQSIHVSGDYFPVVDLDDSINNTLDNELITRLKGVENAKENVEKALDGLDFGKYILNLTTEKFLSIIFN